MMGKTSKISKKNPILTPEVMEKVVEVFMEYFEEAPGLYLKPLAAVYAYGVLMGKQEERARRKRETA